MELNSIAKVFYKAATHHSLVENKITEKNHKIINITYEMFH